MEFLNFEGLAYFKNKENSQIAPVESTTTASQAYEIGQYFWYEGKLYEATAAIALGDTFVTSGDSANCELADIATDISDARERIGTLEGQVTDLETNKANIDGYYSEMTVGNAEQIVSTVGVEDKTPYNFRTAGGSVDIGDREEDMVVGGTVAWNQLVTTDTNVSKTKSGDIVTVNDAVAGNAEDLVVNFEPQQDLHGQDAPYPAGGGKNKCGLFEIGSFRESSPDGTAYSDMLMSSDNRGRSVEPIKVNVPCTISCSDDYQFVITKFDADELYVGQSSFVSWTRLSILTTDWDQDGKYIAIVFKRNDGANLTQQDFDNVHIQVEDGTSATPYSPYSNICPITGWTGCEVNVANDNLIAVPHEGTGGMRYWYLNTGFLLKKGVTYTLKHNHDNSVAVYFRNAAGTDTAPNCTGNGTAKAKCTPTEDMLVSFRTYASSASVYPDNFILELTTDEDAQVVAHQGSSVSVIWQTEAGTVYGGTWNPVTGKLTANRTTIVLDGTESYTNYTSVIVLNGTRPTGKTTAGEDIKCSHCSNIYAHFSNSGNQTVQFTKSIFGVDGVDSFKTYLTGQYNASTPVQYSYELATPVEYTLTAQRIALLAGTNNVWNTIGSTQMTYLGTLNEITAQSGRKYLTRVNGVSTVVNGSGQTLSGEKGRDNIFDLTQMFGSSIANYVYSLENTSAGDGVTWFTDLFPKPYYSYNAGQLMSVNTSAHKTVGFNAWDGTYEANKRLANPTTGAVETANGYNLTGYIPILPNTVYYKAKTDSSRGLFYDYDKNVIPESSWSMPSNSALITTPPNAYYVRITTTNAYINTFILNLSWDGERDGEYEAYEEHTYALDSSLTLRGIPKLDSGNKLYYDGDTYEDDGTVTRKWAEYTVTGNETFYVNSGYIKSDASDAYIEVTSIYSGMQIFNAKGIANKTLLLQVNTSIWNTTGYPNTFTTNANQLHMNFANAVVGITAYTQETTSSARDKIKAYCKALYDAGTPLKFILPLKNTTTESADPYQNPQIVNDFGTEEYVDYSVLNNEREVSIPVGHVTMYQANLRAKLEMIPNSPDGDGDYIVRQSNGVNEYVQLVIPEELPESPTSNGTYILQATVSGGTTTLAWVSAT